MKKLLLLLMAINLACISAWSQIDRDLIKKKTVTQTKTAPATSTTPAPVYSLTGVKVSVRTGSDNKEFPSGFYANLWLKDHADNNYTNASLYRITDLRNEMAKNSTTEVGLNKEAGIQDKFLLSSIQRSGVELIIYYFPNFFMDAWKIENITCTLEFRDQNGNLHPTLGTKILNFSNATGFLNDEYRYFKCTTDQNLNPLMAAITK